MTGQPMLLLLLLLIAAAISLTLPGASCIATSKTVENLRTVDLSNRGLEKEDFFMKLQHQINVHEVNELILRGNKFDKFLDCSTKLDNLQILDLSYNYLNRFFFLCNDEYNLVALNVSHNQIEYIDDQALSHRVMKLEILDVSYNDLYVVNDTMLQHMKNLVFLSLASNPIGENIDALVFQNLSKLHHLNLRNISSPYFSPALFEPLTELEYLDLSENPIEDVPPLPSGIRTLYICGTNILHLGTFVMPRLRVLALDSSANLTSVLLNNFENLTELEVLSMSNSPRLAQIRLRPPNAHLLPRLKRLSVQGCVLESLGEELLPIIQRTAVLDLQRNPWRCDCKMKWINGMNLTTDLVNSFRCKSPSEHANKLLHEIPSEELVCREPLGSSMASSSILFPALWSVGSLLILGLAAGAVFHYGRGCLSQWFDKMRHRRAGTVSYSNVVESHNDHNDLVRILPVGETNDNADV